jgi:hypothetical protein
MEFALVIRELLGHKRWLLVGIVVATAAAVLSIYRVEQLVPPKLKPRSLQYSSATIQAYVDMPSSFVGSLAPPLPPEVDRATVFANLMVSPGALDLIGHDSGIPGDQIWAAGPVDPTQQRVVQEPTATKRNYQVAGETEPYRIEFLANPNLPIISIYTQAPTGTQAVALANGSVQALSRYVHDVQIAQKVPDTSRVTIRTIGQASGAVVNGGIAKKLAGLVFFVVFAGWCVLVLVMTRFRANWRRSGLAVVTRAEAVDVTDRATAGRR